MIRGWRLVVLAGLFAAACSGDITIDSDPAQVAPATAVATPTTAPQPQATSPAPTPTSEPEPDPTVEVGSPDQLADLAGRIVVTADTDLSVIEPDGAVVSTFEQERFIFQPAWSHDGATVGFTAADQSSASLFVFDPDDPNGAQQTPVESLRYYYSWSDDGSRLASLGDVGTETGLLLHDADGTVAAPSIASRALYIAWEPGGSDLIIHAASSLTLVDGITGEIGEPLGTVGTSFLAADWIPGARDVVVVTGPPGSQSLARVDVDDGSATDLVTLGGPADVSVSPTGDRLTLTHPGGLVEIYELATGDRLALTTERSVWTEWSPDGQHVLVLAVVRGMGSWRVYDTDGTEFVGPSFQPLGPDANRYLPFFDQYSESYKRWSPDSRAFVFPGIIDGRSGVWVQQIDPLLPPVPIAVGEVAFWSPA